MNSKENIKLTPIQTDYKELFNRTEIVHDSAIHRLNQIDKEIAILERERDHLGSIVNNTRETIKHMKS